MGHECANVPENLRHYPHIPLKDELECRLRDIVTLFREQTGSHAEVTASLEVATEGNHYYISIKEDYT